MNEQQTGREKMTDNIEQYKNCLDGLTKDMPEEFFKLAQVFELSVFEPIHMEGKKDIYAAYLMNDAVESYFVFEQSVMTGSYKELECQQTASIVHDDNGYMLIVNQSGENRFTIRFTNLHMQTTCFDYGCMGHFWVKGYEYLRQLEYQFADIRDKYRYLGKDFCTERELIFMQLADFPPIKKFRSVPEQYYVPYPDFVYPEAVRYLIETAESVDDKKMSAKLDRYQRKPTAFRCNMLARMFYQKAHSRFVDKIIADMRRTSAGYPRRTFNEQEEQHYQKVHQKAENAMNSFLQKGQACLLYREEPFMYAKDSITYKEHVLVFKKGLVNRKCEIYTFE